MYSKESQKQISDGLKWEGNSKKLRGKRKFGRVVDKFLAFTVDNLHVHLYLYVSIQYVQLIFSQIASILMIKINFLM